MEPQKIPKGQSKREKRNAELEAIYFLISNYITKVWEFKWYDTAINRHIDRWNRIESPERNQSMCSQLIFAQDTKNTQCGKDRLLINGAGKTKYPHAKERNWILSSPLTKVNSK